MHWLQFCHKLNRFLEQCFEAVGLCISRHPFITLCIGIFLTLALMGGFARFHLITRVEDLYIPQDSKALKDLEQAGKHFTLKTRFEEVIILRKDGKSALDVEVFQNLLDIHSNIVSIPGFQEICIKGGSSHCIVNSPLEIFNYSITNDSNIVEVLNNTYVSNSILSNFRTAEINYPDYFAYFEYDYSHKEIKRAEAVRNMYFVVFPEDDDSFEKAMVWEKKFINYMDKMVKKLDSKGLKLLFSSGRSLDDSVTDSSEKDIKLITFSFTLMFLFCAVTLARFRNRVIGHFMLSIGGIFTLAFGIGASFGLVILLGSPYIAFVGVLPFLILGVGIDNMFIIADCVDRQPPNMRGRARIAKALGEVGSSITMTTLTDMVAFGVSMVTDFPSIKYFCLYAAVCIAVCYILVITVFIAMLSLDVRRIEAGRNDFLPCLIATNDVNEVWIHNEGSISKRIMNRYATALMKKPVKYAIFIISLTILALGIFGAIHIDQSFEMLDLGLDDSAYVKFYSYRNKAYPTGFDINVIIDKPIDYSDLKIQIKYEQLDEVPKQNKYMKDKTINWMTVFRKWAKRRNMATEKNYFYMHLRKFLQEYPQYFADMKINQNFTKIIASRVIMYNKDNDNSIFRKDTMLSLRRDLEDYSELHAYPIHMMFIYIEQFVIILRDTIRNLAICAGAILLITLPYLAHPVITALVFFGFASLIFELLGLMYIWNVSLNSISMIVIVMSIGFAVDYSAHVAHAFMVSRGSTPEARVVDALNTMGTSVMMGGLSTFIGIIVTAFASSELFRIFFKMVFGIVVLGLLHGLLFLPVLLSIFCRSDLRARFDAVNNANNRALLPSGQESNLINETAMNRHIDGRRRNSNEMARIDVTDPC